MASIGDLQCSPESSIDSGYCDNYKYDKFHAQLS